MVSSGEGWDIVVNYIYYRKHFYFFEINPPTLFREKEKLMTILFFFFWEINYQKVAHVSKNALSALPD